MSNEVYSSWVQEKSIFQNKFIPEAQSGEVPMLPESFYFQKTASNRPFWKVWFGEKEVGNITIIDGVLYVQAGFPSHIVFIYKKTLDVPDSMKDDEIPDEEVEVEFPIIREKISDFFANRGDYYEYDKSLRITLVNPTVQDLIDQLKTLPPETRIELPAYEKFFIHVSLNRKLATISGNEDRQFIFDTF